MLSSRDECEPALQGADMGCSREFQANIFLFSQHLVDAETYISLWELAACSLPAADPSESTENRGIRSALVSRFWSM
jgi:hypothetical protein